MLGVGVGDGFENLLELVLVEPDAVLVGLAVVDGYIENIRTQHCAVALGALPLSILVPTNKLPFVVGFNVAHELGEYVPFDPHAKAFSASLVGIGRGLAPEEAAAAVGAAASLSVGHGPSFD